MTTRNPLSSLDGRLIIGASLLGFVPWLTAALVIAWAGYPGVVCITPLAWVMACPVGLRIETRSASPGAKQRLVQAALAGALLGLLQGVLFALLAARMGPIAADEQTSATAISLGMLCAGIPIAAGLSIFTAWLAQRRSGSTL